MTQEEKRIKLASASKGIIELYKGVWYYWDDKANRHSCKDNDPFEDLNAVHELEKTLLPDLSIYRKELIKLCDLYAFKNGYDNLEWWPTTAAAAQRAEAIGLTLNLWTE